jgi:hypothetical protein
VAASLCSMVPEAEMACGTAIQTALQFDPQSAEALQIAASYNISCKRLDEALVLLRRSHDIWRELIARAHKFDNDDDDNDDEAGDEDEQTNRMRNSNNNNSNNNNNNSVDDDNNNVNNNNNDAALNDDELLAIPSVSVACWKSCEKRVIHD